MTRHPPLADADDRPRAATPAEAAHRGRRPAWARVLIYAAAWLPLLAILFVAMNTGELTIGAALLFALANALPHALLGGVVLRLPRWLPWPEHGRARAVLAHLAIALGYALLALGGWALLIGLARWLVDGRFDMTIDRRIVPWQLLLNVLIFSALAGLAHAWHNAARAASEAGRAARAETLRATAELAALRSQLNPHFIFNTLHVVLGLVRRAPELAESAIEQLGDLLRYGLRIQREAVDEVSLREEWAFVESYLALERLRLGERLRLDVRVDVAALDRPVPCFAVQTLVENAVRHAIAPRVEGGRLGVHAALDGDTLRIEVEDDGPGTLSGVRSAPGRGLSLLRERLSALYGASGRLELRPGSIAGVRATLEIPGVRDRLDDAR